MPTVYKDPSDVVPQSFDWALVIPTDTITTSTWTPDTGITTATPTFAGKVTTVWLSGGTAEVTYKIVNRIVTTAGRTLERTIRVKVRDR